MIQKLDFLVRFWELRARHAELGEPLDQREQTELLSLLQLVTSDLRVPEIGPALRGASSTPAQMLAERAAVGVELRAVTAAALVVSSPETFPVGTQVVVRITDALGGVEYVLPCRVEWSHRGDSATMALVVDGVPSRSSFGHEAASAPERASLVRHVERLMSWSARRRAPHAGARQA